MSDFLDWGSSYNSWNLDELSYEGELYHYTNGTGCAGIYTPKYFNGNPIDLPPGCVALRFTRIESMRTGNDKKERIHIVDDIPRAIDDLKNIGKISSDFARTVHSFRPQNRGFSSIVTEEYDEKFHQPIIRWDIAGELNYYVACFSTNPNNLHIKQKFCTPNRIAFRSEFSSPQKALKNWALGKIPGYYTELNPFSSLYECGLYYSLRRVVYGDNEKRCLLKDQLMAVYERYDPLHPQDINDDLQDVYSLYEAFFKSAEYEKEQEVRFVIRIGADKPRILEEHNILFDSCIVDGQKKEYLYLPVSKEFLVGTD